MDNQSTFSDFLLLDFSEMKKLQMLYFCALMVFYLAILTANLLIIFAIIFNHHLHTPMYFFLMNLAIQDLMSSSVIIPKSMVNTVMNARHISYLGCVSQVFFLVFFLGSDFWILPVMAYDRYVAICKPLHYQKIMNKQACIHMILAIWVSGLVTGLLHTSVIFSTCFCSNIINQFFCEIPQLMKLTCTGLNQNELKLIVVIFIFGMICFFFILISYVSILIAVLKIRSLEGRRKAVSPCLPHIIVVSIFLLCVSIAHLRPSSDSPDLVTAVLYAIVPPLLNPIIYSMRNKDIKIALSNLLNMKKISKRIHLTFHL